MVINLHRQVSDYIDKLPKEQSATIYAVLEDIKQYGGCLYENPYSHKRYLFS